MKAWLLILALLIATVLAHGASKTPINNGILQSDLDAAGFKILTANLSDYAGTNLTWNAGTGKFDASAGGVAAIPVSSTIYVDKVNGSDIGTNSGQRGRFDKPFQSPEAALAVAVSGDVVYCGGNVTPYTLAAPLVIPANVSFIGAGAGRTILTGSTAVTRALVEPGTDSYVSDMTIQNTGAGAAYGVGTSSAAFTRATLASCNITGALQGIYLNKTGSTGLLVQNCTVSTTLDTVFSGVAGSHTFKNVDFISTSTAGLASRAINASAGTIKVFNSTMSVGGAVSNNVAAVSQNSGTTVELHDVQITRTAGGTLSFDLLQSSSAMMAVESVTRTDYQQLSNSGTITDISGYASIYANGSDFTNSTQFQVNMGLVPGSDVQAYSVNLDSLSALTVNLANAGKSVVVNTGGTGFDLTTVTGGGSSATKVDMADTNLTVTGTPTVINLTTALTASRVITLPAASTYTPLTPMVIEDPRAVESGAFTISLARAGSDTINGGTSNVAVLSAATAGGAVQIMSDGVSKWSTITKAQGIGGNVVGPASVIDNTIAVYDGTTGKLLKDGSNVSWDTNYLYTKSLSNYDGAIFYTSGGGWFTFTQSFGTGLQIASPYGLLFTSSSTVPNTPDTGFSRNAAGVLEINSGTVGTYRDLICRDISARIKPRGGSPGAGTGTTTPDADAQDMVVINSITGNVVFGAPSGSPVDGQSLMFRGKSDASIHTVAWNAIYTPMGVTLPLATVASKKFYVGCKYNSNTTTWDVLAVGLEP